MFFFGLYCVILHVHILPESDNHGHIKTPTPVFHQFGFRLRCCIHNWNIPMIRSAFIESVTFFDPVCLSVGRSVIISYKGGSHFHAPIGALVSYSMAFNICLRRYTRLQKDRIFFQREDRGEIGGEEEENIAKQSDHVLKPWFMRIKLYHFFVMY